jgi:hypothetical protein
MDSPFPNNYDAPSWIASISDIFDGILPAACKKDSCRESVVTGTWNTGAVYLS